MLDWNEIITEAKKMSAAEIKKAGEAALKNEQNKNSTKKPESEYTKYLKQQLEFKRKKYEDQKKAQIENIKKRRIGDHLKKAKKSLSSIHIQKSGSKETDPTISKKTIENIGSVVGGVGGAAYHGIRYLLAKKRIKKQQQDAEKNQLTKKEMGSPGRPKKNFNDLKPNPPNSIDNNTKKIGGTSHKLLMPSSNSNTDSLGQRARKDPKLKSELIKKSINEKFSNWREELIIEIDDISAEKDNKFSERIIDVMPPKKKNKIELNPKISESYKDEEGEMSRNELSTIERAVKSLRRKIKSNEQQLPAWVQSKISKATDYIDTVADYMDGNPEPVKEMYDDEFRQHSRGITSGGNSSQNSSNSNSSLLKRIKELRLSKPPKKKKKKKVAKQEIENDETIIEASAAWQRKEGKNPKGGLNKKGIASYRRENPGSHLSLAVTTPPSKLDPDSKSAKRRRSFCARMGGMPGPMKDEKGRLTRKALSLKKWNC